jgi:hypothetical protein
VIELAVRTLFITRIWKREHTKVSDAFAADVTVTPPLVSKGNIPSTVTLVSARYT